MFFQRNFPLRVTRTKALAIRQVCHLYNCQFYGVILTCSATRLLYVCQSIEYNYCRVHLELNTRTALSCCKNLLNIINQTILVKSYMHVTTELVV